MAPQVTMDRRRKLKPATTRFCGRTKRNPLWAAFRVWAGHTHAALQGAGGAGAGGGAAAAGGGGAGAAHAAGHKGGQEQAVRPHDLLHIKQ